MRFSAEAKLEEIYRELRLRRQLYPRWVASEKMKATDADYQIEIMQAIAADYEQLAQKDRLL